ncbi:MAG: hypothetical protein LBI69_01985 [Puniceicoccales bacterium]|jgi:hypothetical protein|nr:hypothetical protein [Puniceicoccales bacterium]
MASPRAQLQKNEKMNGNEEESIPKKLSEHSDDVNIPKEPSTDFGGLEDFHDSGEISSENAEVKKPLSEEKKEEVRSMAKAIQGMIEHEHYAQIAEEIVNCIERLINSLHMESEWHEIIESVRASHAFMIEYSTSCSDAVADALLSVYGRIQILGKKTLEEAFPFIKQIYLKDLLTSLMHPADQGKQISELVLADFILSDVVFHLYEDIVHLSNGKIFIPCSAASSMCSVYECQQLSGFIGKYKEKIKGCADIKINGLQVIEDCGKFEGDIERICASHGFSLYWYHNAYMLILFTIDYVIQNEHSEDSVLNFIARNAPSYMPLFIEEDGIFLAECPKVLETMEKYRGTLSTIVRGMYAEDAKWTDVEIMSAEDIDFGKFKWGDFQRIYSAVYCSDDANNKELLSALNSHLRQGTIYDMKINIFTERTKRLFEKSKKFSYELHAANKAAKFSPIFR